jgi:hypothetical protein
MDRARERANAALRRSGIPRERWLGRAPIAPETREAFAATVAEEDYLALRERGLSFPRALPPLLRRAVDRTAIRRALVAHGILHFKRRRIPPPIKSTILDRSA